jgi:hypothetical protein
MVPIKLRDIMLAEQRFDALAPIVWFVDQRCRSNRVATVGYPFERNDYRFNVQQITLIRSISSHYAPDLPVLLDAFIASISVRACDTTSRHD